MITRRKIIPYNPELKELAKELRRNMTLSEVLLWNELKQKQMLGFDIKVKRDILNVLREIEYWINLNKPTPCPSQEGNKK